MLAAACLHNIKLPTPMLGVNQLHNHCANTTHLFAAGMHKAAGRHDGILPLRPAATVAVARPADAAGADFQCRQVHS
jgi:hypothetical protein